MFFVAKMGGANPNQYDHMQVEFVDLASDGQRLFRVVSTMKTRVLYLINFDAQFQIFVFIYM